MADAQQDKRSTRRFALRLPVSVTYSENGEQSKCGPDPGRQRAWHLVFRGCSHCQGLADRVHADPAP